MMDVSLFEILKTGVSIFVAGFAAYSAIKQDLIKHNAEIQALKSDVKRLDKRDDNAHSRIDEILKG